MYPITISSVPVTGATCSENVTKQNPEVEFHSFTFESSPPVAMYCPSDEKSRVLMPYKWPCCLSTYVSDCTYRIHKYNEINRVRMCRGSILSYLNVR